jgi:hypothetical protein
LRSPHTSAAPAVCQRNERRHLTQLELHLQRKVRDL